MAYIRQLKTGLWQAQFYRQGVRKSASFKEREDAQNWITSLKERHEKEHAAGRFPPPRRRKARTDYPYPLIFAGLKSKDEILSSSVAAKPPCGVYFLILKDEIVYVGQSVNIWARVSNHKSTGIQFDRVAFIECAENVLCIEESRYILQFQPKHNFTQAGTLKLSADRDYLGDVEKWQASTSERTGSGGHRYSARAGGSPEPFERSQQP